MTHVGGTCSLLGSTLCVYPNKQQVVNLRWVNSIIQTRRQRLAISESHIDIQWTGRWCINRCLSSIPSGAKRDRGMQAEGGIFRFRQGSRVGGKPWLKHVSKETQVSVRMLEEKAMLATLACLKLCTGLLPSTVASPKTDW